MRIYVKEGKLYIANIKDRNEMIIRADNEIWSLNSDFTGSGWEGVEATAFDKIEDEIEGVKIK
jgi:hypothetical protein